MIQDKDKMIFKLEQQLKEQKEEYEQKLKEQKQDYEKKLKEQKKDFEKKLEAQKQELQKKEVEWLQMFKQIYNLSKKSDFHSELKQALSSMKNSLKNSQTNSPVDIQSPFISIEDSIKNEPTDSIPEYAIDCIKNSNLLDEEIKEQIDTRSKISQRISESNNIDNYNSIDETYRPLSFKIQHKAKSFSKTVRQKHQIGSTQINFANHVVGSFGNTKYAQNTGRETFIKVLGKRTGKTLDINSNVNDSNPCIRKKDLNLEQNKKSKKNPLLIALRKQQIKKIVGFLKINKHRLTTIQTINKQLFFEYPEIKNLKLKSINKVFCDGMYFPKTNLTDTIQKVQELFEQFHLVAKSVKNSAHQEFWFVKLDEVATPKWEIMKQRLLKLMQYLRKMLQVNIYLKQLDRTKDYQGYFVCNNIASFTKHFSKFGLNKSSNSNYKSFSTCVNLEMSHQDQLNNRIKIIDRRIKIYNKTISPLFAPESVFKKAGMGSCAFFHCSPEYFQCHLKTEMTGRLRIEESNYFQSIEEEEHFLLNQQDDLIEEVAEVIEKNGKEFVRFIPFENIWGTFWDSVSEHFFLFENRKVAIIYFYNTETCDFIGPVYDAGPRFKRENCKKRYSIFQKQAVVVENGVETEQFVKFTNSHQYPIPPLNASHLKNRHAFKTKHWYYEINVDNIQLQYLQNFDQEELGCCDPKVLHIPSENIIERKDKQGRWIEVQFDDYKQFKFRFKLKSGAKMTQKFVYCANGCSQDLVKENGMFYLAELE